MARMTQKRRDALKAVSRLQKRARDKEYSLRKRGAVGIRIGSPRLNYGEVRGMTTQQLKAYARRLERFNNTKMTVLQSGDVVKVEDLKKIRKNIRIYNVRIERERKRYEAAQRERVRKGLQKEVKPFPVQTVAYRRPYSAGQAESLAGKSKKWAKRDPRKLMRSRRRSAVAMLKAVGLDKEAGRISNMRTEDLEQLIDNYGLLDDVALWYRADREMMERQIRSNPDDFAIFETRTKMAIRSARNQ